MIKINENNINNKGNFGCISFLLIKGLLEYMNKILFVYNVHASFKPTNSLSSLFSKLKDKYPILNQKNSVYKIDCLICDSTYKVRQNII